ncbi:MAG: hypothetical protein J0L84_01715 [Verrucomicrobia bacterium]|nr:hypothetical protein [Verrucomicrobiota bacterium]
MTANPLKEYARLRQVILARKAAIESELQELERTLAQIAFPPDDQSLPRVPLEKPKRVRNSMSLGDAVFAVTQSAPLSKDEILTALDRMGYRFPEKATPRDEVASVLQLDQRFEESNGRYGPTLESLFPAA